MEAMKLLILFAVIISAISAQENCPVRNSMLNCEARSCAETRECRKAGKVCECDGGCGWSCLPRGCPAIDAPPNGGVEIDPANRTIGSIATFTCDFGYVLNDVGNPQCLANKTWSESTDAMCECKRNYNEVGLQRRTCLRLCSTDIDCNAERGRTCVCDDICGLSCIRTSLEDFCDPADLDSDNVETSINPITAVFGAVATQTCLEGYLPANSTVERRCIGSTEWTNENLICIPENHCTAPPPEVPLASHSEDRTYYLPGDKVYYVCQTGYYQTGRIFVTCLVSYEWENTAQECIPKSCGEPDGIVNGDYKGTVYTFGQSVTYRCYDRYQLVGLATRYCQSNQEWSGSAPSCNLVSCAEPNPLENVIQEWNNGKLRYSCQPGYALNGWNTLTCQGGSWDGPQPTCNATFCNTSDLPEVPYIRENRQKVKDGLLLPDNNFGTSVANNQKLRVKCTEGYSPLHQYIICKKGHWEVRRSQCESPTKTT